MKVPYICYTVSINSPGGLRWIEEPIDGKLANVAWIISTSRNNCSPPRREMARSLHRVELKRPMKELELSRIYKNTC